MRRVMISLCGVLMGTSPAFAAPSSYYSYYDPIYDSGVVEENLTPQGASLGESLFGNSGGGVGGFLSSMTLHAQAATAVDYNDNVRLSDTNREGDIANTTSAGLAAESDWDRHAFSFGVNGNIRRYRENVSENRDGLYVFTAAQADISENIRLIAGAHYLQDSELRDNPQEFSNTLSRLRNYEETGGELGLDFDGGLFAISSRATYKHLVFEKLDGETLGFRDRDIARYTTRISYPVTDAVRVFLQPAYANEVYDLSRDASGINRDSTTYELLGGIVYNITDITQLDFGIGQIRREFDDARLSDTQGLRIDGALLWSPYEEFNLGMSLSRTIEGTTLSGVNDITVTSARLLPAYSITEAVILTGELGMDRFAFSGNGRTDTDYLSSLGLSYLWNDAIQTGIRYRYRNRISNVANRDFYSNSILLTLSFGL